VTQTDPGPSPYGERSPHYANIPLHLILTLLTFYIFNLYWNYRQMIACNELLGRREFGFLTWLLLSIVTCGLYHLYYQYKMGSALVEIEDERGLHAPDGLPIISVIAAILGVGVVADCIHQQEINKIVG
jgi:hypothetical protein